MHIFLRHLTDVAQELCPIYTNIEAHILKFVK